MAQGGRGAAGGGETFDATTRGGLVAAGVLVAVAPAPVDRVSEAFDLSSKSGGLVAGLKYVMAVRYVGSGLHVGFPQEPKDDGPVERRPPPWSARRSGGIAFLVPEGTRPKVARMRLKDLR